jgi:hypothetical protein
MFSGLEQSLRTMLKSVLIEVVKEVTASSPQPQQIELASLKSPPVLWRPSEAAKALAISERHLWALTRAEQIPCVRISRLVRYDPVALRDWVRFASSSRFSVQRNVGSAEEKSTSGTPRDHRKMGTRSSSKQGDSKTIVRRKSVARSPRRQPNRGDLDSDSTQGAGLNRPPRDVRALFAERLGVSPEQLPRLTNGQLMQIADVDTATLHGWIHLGRDMPEAAIQRLQSFYASELKVR